MNRKIKDLAKAKDLNKLDKEYSVADEEDVADVESIQDKDNGEIKKEAPKIPDLSTLMKKELVLFSISAQYWKWLVFIICIAVLIIVFYFLGFYMSSKKIVVAAGNDTEISQGNVIFGEQLASNYAIGRSPVKFEVLDVRARGALIVDADSGSIIAGVDQDKQLPVASLTKLVTANVALRYWDPEDEIAITVEVDPDVESSAELKKGEKYKVGDLIQALLIQSAAEAGYTLADSYPGGRDGFVEAMNGFCEQYGLENSNFVDPVGIDRKNISTAQEMAIITRLALQNRVISEAVAKKETQICSLDGFCTQLENTNELLEKAGYQGVKTGYTVAAGPCLSAYYSDNDGEYIVILLNAFERFETVDNLVSYY